MTKITVQEQLEEQEKNRIGVVGLVLSIIGLCLCGFWLFTIPGLILSLIGLRKEPRTAATTGAIIGGLGVLIFPLIVAILLPVIAAGTNGFKIARTHLHMKQIEIGSNAYYDEHHTYASSLDELVNSEHLSSDDALDGWGNTIQYEGGGKNKPTFQSAGEDGEFGTSDDVESKQ